MTTGPRDDTDAPSFEAIAGTAKSGIVLICDHASNRIPQDLQDLGLDLEALRLHVAWDIGAAGLTRSLAARLGAPAVLSRVSRLVVDCNRAPGHATSMPAVSHGVTVPGNRDLSPHERARRTQRYFEPYHRAVGEALAAIEAAGATALLVSVHSFTPVLGERARPWHCGVLYDRDRRLAEYFLRALSAERDLVVGDNEPYSGAHPEGYTCRRHGDAFGRPNVLIEVRQDLINDDAGVAAWAARLGAILAGAALRVGDRGARPRAATAAPGAA